MVIYRVPAGLSVNSPRRSFCPKCKTEIPWYRNIPVGTWILQRGKCAACGEPIAVRYLLVELLTACLFVAAWLVAIYTLPEPRLTPAILMMVMVVLLVAISCIDAEHMLIPVVFCWWGMAIAVIGNSLDPLLVTLVSVVGEVPWWKGGVLALIGLAAGWGILALVVILGKLLLGQRKEEFEEPTDWSLREAESDEEELSFVVGEERIGWSELFYRKNDRIVIEGRGILVDGEPTEATEITIYRESILVDDERKSIESLKSLSGKAQKVIIPREAMGAGDPPLLGMIGAFIGWEGVLFTLFSSCLYALFMAALGRIGFGRPQPFGPFLALGGLTWVFGGWKIWIWYFEKIGGF